MSDDVNDKLWSYGRRVMGDPISLDELLISHEFLYNEYMRFETYVRSIGLETMRFRELLASHKWLRDLNLENVSETNKKQKEAVDSLIGEMRQTGFISKDALRDMNIDELFYMLHPEKK